MLMKMQAIGLNQQHALKLNIMRREDVYKQLEFKIDDSNK